MSEYYNLYLLRMAKFDNYAPNGKFIPKRSKTLKNKRKRKRK